ncbi:MAG: DsbA family protein [Gammaproteobacteria bacterium]|nr:DsbA family protein [Gammaproteobacteria bacterium]
MLDLMGRFHHALFSAMHKQKRKIYTENAILDFVTELGMDEKAFKEAMHSFAVETKIRRSKQLVKASGIQGVPAVIVNGKYRTSGSLAGSYPRMVGIIDELVAEELALLPQPAKP